MTKLELIVKVKRLEADCKAYNFTQHELQENIREFENEIQWERNITSELADHLGKANDRVADLEDKLANADYQIEGRDLKIKDLEETIDKLREQLALRYDLEDKIKELEAQIEKMKCCYNCSKWNEGLLLCNDSTVRVTTYADYCCEDWEIKGK